MNRDDIREFAFEEYKTLRSEIEIRSQMDFSVQRNTMIASGAIFTFVLSQLEKNPEISIALYSIPALLYIALLKQSRHKKYGVKIGKYIANLEEYFYRNDDSFDMKRLGWESHLEQTSQNNALELTNKKERGGDHGILFYPKALLNGLSLKKSPTASATLVDGAYLSWAVLITFSFATAKTFF